MPERLAEAPRETWEGALVRAALEAHLHDIGPRRGAKFLTHMLESLEGAQTVVSIRAPDVRMANRTALLWLRERLPAMLSRLQ